MSTEIADRLNQILPLITADGFLSSEGLGAEIACHIFDYPAREERKVREHIGVMMKRLESHHRELKVLHLNLLEVVLAYLEGRGLLDKVLQMQKTKDDKAILRALRGPLAAEKIRDFIEDEYTPADYALVLMSGVGSVWPMLRAHSLLNCLHTVMGKTPLVMFYPGSFDGTALNLFSQIQASTPKPGPRPYYRAFSLVPNRGDA
jgi:hypothetical protein